MRNASELHVEGHATLLKNAVRSPDISIASHVMFATRNAVNAPTANRGQEIEQAVRQRAGELGLKIALVGIRDVILPGEMKDLMNKVTEAKKAAEAAGTCSWSVGLSFIDFTSDELHQCLNCSG